MTNTLKVLLLIIGIISLIGIGENSLCRSVSCMRKNYNVGDKICYLATSSFSTLIHHDKNGLFAKNYMALRDMIFPENKTVIYREDFKVIGLLENGDVLPFEKIISENGEVCITITK